ncbi:hypothetical protein SAMN05661091_4086 [Paenibacillus uliginis N3/975]|uniref:Uncharacterized protein n=1 Tax=Paenibacillus uliginis N3/975 TaxID=1313296 RepID=A0A1X7HL42_9BACL|nr:hypothetical protein [Paenibacillus uliginis]SMF88053.1 hypothetical protein SAMN05661091_4086 [Paenibacillus uliginis N3/975]
MIGKASEIFVTQIKTIENDLDLRITKFLSNNPAFQIIKMDFTTVMMVRGSHQQQTQYARDTVFITYKQP